ncbi:hypothetical protein EDD66_1126 [Mobilisporobacter senegalensis]|uniref:Uncharacterized protein n=1 Tax=Mobilisporobacter senegalensis TaxID=1329262 RepID=A0A3N1XAZ3_9FIRM|nr:hypothetical protein [Mobilisporobacter senegalensis]ROR23875.1 hypothetical protein EDD66_1126 [Mobilisporobacter senegalensis]
MGQKANRNRIASAIVLCLVVISFLSSFYIAKEINHKCIGEDCSVCTHIHEAENSIKLLGNLKIELVNILNITFALCLFLNTGNSNNLLLTPITSKVRMNH